MRTTRSRFRGTALQTQWQTLAKATVAWTQLPPQLAHAAAKEAAPIAISRRDPYAHTSSARSQRASARPRNSASLARARNLFLDLRFPRYGTKADGPAKSLTHRRRQDNGKSDQVQSLEDHAGCLESTRVEGPSQHCPSQKQCHQRPGPPITPYDESSDEEQPGNRRKRRHRMLVLPEPRVSRGINEGRDSEDDER